MDIANLTTILNTETGVAEYLLIAPVSWFTAIKAPEPPYTDPGDEVRIKSTHTFKEGLGFVRVDLAPEKNYYGAITAGETGWNRLAPTLTALVAGSYAQLHATVKKMMNTPCIVLIKDSNCPANMHYQVGGPYSDALCTWSFTTGTTKEGNKAVLAQVQSTDGYIRLYEGGITMLNEAVAWKHYVFLAADEVELCIGDTAALEQMESQAQSTLPAEIVTLLATQADRGHISTGRADSNGQAHDIIINADLGSVAALETVLETFSGYPLQENDMEKWELDNNRHLGIAVPENLLGDDEITLLVDDGVLLDTGY